MQRSTLHRTQWLCAQGYHHLIDLMKAHRNTYLGIRSLMNSYVYVGLWVDRRAPGWAYMPSYNPSHEDAVKRIHQLLCLAKQLHLCSSLGLSFMIEGHSRSNSSANLVDSATATIAPQQCPLANICSCGRYQAQATLETENSHWVRALIYQTEWDSRASRGETNRGKMNTTNLPALTHFRALVFWSKLRTTCTYDTAIFQLTGLYQLANKKLRNYRNATFFSNWLECDCFFAKVHVKQRKNWKQMQINLHT